MCFKLFRENLEKYYKEKGIYTQLPTNNFLYWFIGFSEGDGSFVVNKENELLFILIQGNKIILENILFILNLGEIFKNNKRIYHLIIKKKIEIDLIILLFNGNIVLPTTKIKFNIFFKTYLIKNKSKSISYLNNKNYPLSNNTWLLGFFEAEGCFTASLILNSKNFRIRFIIRQKGIINLPIFKSLSLKSILFYFLFRIHFYEQSLISRTWNQAIDPVRSRKTSFNKISGNN